MSLTSEMARITGEFEAAQGARLATVAKIGPSMRRGNHANKTSLRRTMATHRAATKSSLRDIFGIAAFTRGAAVELVESFRNEREKSANDLRDQLGAFAADLKETVSEALADLTATRLKKARRDESTRRAQFKDLRRRVDALLASAGELIANFNQDRERAGKLWEQHLRNASRLRRTASRKAVPDAPAPRKKAARKTEKKRKRARA